MEKIENEVILEEAAEDFETAVMEFVETHRSLGIDDFAISMKLDDIVSQYFGKKAVEAMDEVV